MAATMQHCSTATPSPATAAAANPQLKRIVYSKYRELLGSYNDKANAIIETLPAYMVREDRGFHFESSATPPATSAVGTNASAAAACLLQQVAAAQGVENGASGQRGFEAPACVQNAMMTKDKKPFTYTPGGIDLSQIKSERMAKRLARNAQAEGATGASQLNRPGQPQSPGAGAAASVGAVAMGMPFQVLPPPPPPSQAGKKPNGTPAPPPPPPSSSTLAPPTNGGLGSAPGSPNAARKSPTPQSFEPPPMGFRPEIKIPPNPMASLRKVPPPVEKNTFWKDEYVKDRSKSPMVGENDRASSPSRNGSGYGELADNANNNMHNTNNNDYADGVKRSMPATTTQQPEPNYNNNYAPQQQYTPAQQQQQQSPYQQQQQQYSSPPPTVPIVTATPPSPRPEFRSVPVPQSPAVNVYTRQTDNPPSAGTPTQQQRATESPFRYGTQSPQQQQQQQQQRAPPAMSPLAQQQQQQQKTYTPTVAPATTPAPAPIATTPNNQPSAQAQSQSVPWRTQRTQPPTPQQSPHPQASYNNVQPQQQPQQQQSQRSRDVFSPPDSAPSYGGAQNTPYQGPKPTSVGSLYIAPLGPPTEPQAQNIVRQQMQQQQQRDLPMRQAPPQQQQQQQQQQQPPAMRQPARWMSTQPAHKEQPEWARPEENGNVVPSSLNRIKSPPPPLQSQPQQHQPQPTQYQPSNGYAAPVANFGNQNNAPAGLRLQINANTAANQSNGPKERIIPIQLEQTPTYAAPQPSFNVPYGGVGASAAPAGYVIRSPNQFVDQGYNNYPPSSAQQQQQHAAARVMSPTQQLNAPRIVQQQLSNNIAGGPNARVIPIAVDGGEGTRGPISQAPIVLQNDPRSPPVQSKSFRVLQKITDTIGDGSGDGASPASKPDSYIDAEPQLQRPQFARQMSAQQARNSPTIDQMRRMQIAQEQQQQQQQHQSPQAWNQGNNKYAQQCPIYNHSTDMPQPYVHPSEQQVPEPKKYTGSAIPSRSFKILQAMTTPENAVEMEDAKSVELNENELKISNQSSNKNNHDKSVELANNYKTKEEISDTITHCNSTSTSTPTPPPTTTSSCSSSASLNSDSITQPAPSHPYPAAAYGYPYGYPWYPPPVPPAAMANGETAPSWHYPYAMPPPPPTGENVGNMPPAAYPPYPYYYPYYPVPPPPQSMAGAYAPHQVMPPQMPEYDSQNVYQDPNFAYLPCVPPTYPPYPYTVGPSSCSPSASSSRASSLLPDIIVTPSADDVPSQVILQHHVKIEKDKSPKRTDAVEIEEVASKMLQARNNKRREEREGSVIEMLTQRLEDMSKLVENDLNLSKDVDKHYAGEGDKEFGEKSPIDNVSPVLQPTHVIITEADTTAESESDSDELDSEITPKYSELKINGLQAIKSVNNIQVYNAQKLRHFENEDGDEDVTTADGESDIFDDEEDEGELVEELELDDGVEEHDELDLVEEEDLSVIYEEESELERSSDHPKTVIRRGNSSGSEVTTIGNGAGDIEQLIEENDDDDAADAEENDAEDSTSVTVRLPLKFSFSRSSNDENIATVEVGDSQIEEKRHSISSEGKRNSFVVAEIENDSDEEALEPQDYEDDCDVSVTISLTPSSRSGSIDRKMEPHVSNSAAYPAEDIPTPDVRRESVSSSSEDVSASFSLNMRNKFMGQTVKGDVTNNIAEIVADDSVEVKPQLEKQQPMLQSTEELDFFATLRATKMQAQKMMEHSANYWGKVAEKKPDAIQETEVEAQVELEETKEEREETNEAAAVVEDIWGDNNDDELPKVQTVVQNSIEVAKNSFWSTVAEATKDQSVAPTIEKVAENDDEEVDFWAVIEKSRSDDEVRAKVQEAVRIPPVRAEMKEVYYWIPTLESRVDDMPRAQRAEVYVAAAPEPVRVNEIERDDSEDETEEEEEEEVVDVEEEEDFWASVEEAKSSARPASNATPTLEECVMPQSEEQDVDFWAEIEDSKPQNNDVDKPLFDPTQYPAEPREVDTDEEFDFWAEIEAKSQGEDDVNFYKAASFWASRERQNSVDETPYKPMLTKAFTAKLPDEPTVDVNMWAALEAAKGEEPVIIDPVLEEEKVLAVEFNQMEVDDDEPQIAEVAIEQGDLLERASTHEPVVANVWEPKPTTEEPNDCTAVETKSEASVNAIEIMEDRDEVNIKRSNYRKAMAFFTNSIDEKREASMERNARNGRSSNRTSWIEEDAGAMDWPSAALNSQGTATGVTPSYEPEVAPPTDAHKASLQRNSVETTTEAIDNSTLANIELQLPTVPTVPEVYVEPTVQSKLRPNGLPDLGMNDEPKISVRDRIFAFETGSVESPVESKKCDMKTHSLSVESCTPNSMLSRNNSAQRSESEMEEDDSGVTDMNKQLSETDTESESFPELRKMTSYQRAATHSRLFKLLQDENDPEEGQREDALTEAADESQLRPSRRKIVHNVSITRRQNPNALAEAESMTQRRERLSLPLRKNTSIDADNPSTPNSPASPIMGQPSSSRVVSDKLVNELVQSLLLKRDSSHLRQMPMEKLQAAAKRVLEEELDSLENTSVETTPAPTPNESKADKSYADYYDTWSKASGGGADAVPPKAFRALQEVPRRSPWSVRCPRVLSSKTINRDLARVTESPEIFARSSKSPDCLSQSREGSVSRWKKV